MYASPILDAKYRKVEIEEIIKDHYSRLDSGKQPQLRDVLLKHETLFDGILKTFICRSTNTYRFDFWDNTSIQLGWPLIADWAYASIFPVAVQFQN